MEQILSYGFLQRAMLAGIFVALACAFLGVFQILRRDAMIGHGLAHVSFAGVALGLLVNMMPLAAALIVAVLTAVIIMKIKEKARIYEDTAIAIFSSVGFALGIILATFAQKYNVDLFTYLFGEILAIETSEVWLSLVLALIVVSAVLLYYSKFMYITFDKESAKASGIKVNRLELILSVLTAITVVLGMKVVGIIFVVALFVIPSAAGLQIANSFKQAIFFSALVACVSVILGLMLSILIDIPASASIVMLAFIFFLLFFMGKRILRRT